MTNITSFFYFIIILLPYSSIVTLAPCATPATTLGSSASAPFLRCMAIVLAVSYKIDTESIIQRLLERRRRMGTEPVHAHWFAIG